MKSIGTTALTYIIAIIVVFIIVNCQNRQQAKYYGMDPMSEYEHRVFYYQYMSYIEKN